ncbi:MAG: DUF6602 domain-containing protein [Arcticibacter sp.]
MDKILLSSLKEGDRFIDMNSDFSQASLLILGKRKGQQGFFVIKSDFPNEPIYTPMDQFSGDIFPDIGQIHLAARIRKLANAFHQNFGGLITKIYKSAYHKIKVSEAIDHLVQKLQVTPEEASAFLKLQIAKGFLYFETQKGGDVIKLKSVILDIEHKKRFLEGIADELISRSERVELLIEHSVSKGNYRELLLRNVLQKYVPKKYAVATGFIEGCPRQCDIIIYDAHNFSPFFQDGDLVVVPGKSVRAVIEVKSTLSTSELSDALDLLWDVARHRNLPAPFLKAIFAFDKGYQSQEAMADALHNYYNKPEKKIKFLYETVNVISVLNQQCLVTDVIDYTSKDLSIRPRIYKVESPDEDIQVYSATFFNELFSYLDVEKHAKKTNVDYFKMLGNQMQYHLYREIYDQDWKPELIFTNEHHWDLTSLWKRVSDVNNWKAGKYTLQELEQMYLQQFYEPVDLKEQADNLGLVQTSFTPSK